MDFLQDVDWGDQDVLVGSFKSREQFNINFEKKFYYTPLKNIEKGQIIKYVALYQSIATFGDSAGIKFFGKVKKKQILKRRDIPVKTNRDNGDEDYAVFYIEKWQSLEEKIVVLGESVYKPRYTNLFLLQNCAYTYELFCVKSSSQFWLTETLKKAFTFAELNAESKEHYLFKSSANFTVSLQENKINVLALDGKIAFATPIPISEYKLFPVENFNQIVTNLNI